MSAGTFQRCPPGIGELACEILNAYETHKPLVDAKVKFDFVFAFAKVGEAGERLGWAIKRRGVRALGYARIVDLKDRALGHGDAEITLDGDYWGEIGADKQRALLDHELHHIELKTDKFGSLVLDDLKRPILRTRPHDYEFGWFTVIAERHGEASNERIQARTILDKDGQFYWPELTKSSGATVEVTSGGKSSGVMPIAEFTRRANRALARKGA